MDRGRATTNGPNRIELRGVSKTFPGVLANDHASFAVRPGVIHAQLGENGAGKSTLVKMIFGIMQPHAGEVVWDGKPVTGASPMAARATGVGMAFQHFSLFEALTVFENIALGMDGAISRRALGEEIRRVMAEYGLEPSRVVSTLSVVERQRIEIVRALLLKPPLLIMDEPTSLLTPQEAPLLFRSLRQLAAEGCSILYISHKPDKIMELCDTATILRGGRVAGACNPKVGSSKSMAAMMSGGSLGQIAKNQGRAFDPPKPVAEGLSLAKIGDFGTILENISFSVRAGEVLGIPGSRATAGTSSCSRSRESCSRPGRGGQDR